MLTIFETVTAYEICPDISRRGQFLVDQMLGLGAHADNGDEEDLIKRRTIETLGYQLVAEARRTSPADGRSTGILAHLGRLLHRQRPA